MTIMASASPGKPDGTGYEAAMLVTRDIVDVFWALDPNLARRKHFPAISWSASTSNCVPALHTYFDSNDVDIRTLRTSIFEILKSADNLAELIARDGKHIIYIIHNRADDALKQHTDVPISTLIYSKASLFYLD